MFMCICNVCIYTYIAYSNKAPMETGALIIKVFLFSYIVSPKSILDPGDL